MRFTAKTEEELQNTGLLEVGIYPYQIIDSKETISKAGHEMIELKLMIWDKEGRERIMFDWLLEAMGYKLRHFCESHNMLDKYNEGLLTALDCRDKQGKVDVIVQAGKPNPNGGMYSSRNSVKDYVVAEVVAHKEEFDQNLPF
jgi:hypothetical protein